MPSIVRVDLSETQKQELCDIRDHATLPYLRERAGAILKVAQGQTVTEVAEQGLLRKRKQETVREWLKRYLNEGIEGLQVKPGRGRKPAFFP
jgi:hypothetical protein